MDSDWRRTAIAASATLPAARPNLCVKKACELSDKITFSYNIIPVIKSGRMRWKGYVVGVGCKRNAYRVFGGENPSKEITLKT